MQRCEKCWKLTETKYYEQPLESNLCNDCYKDFLLWIDDYPFSERDWLERAQDND